MKWIEEGEREKLLCIQVPGEAWEREGGGGREMLES